MDCGHLKRLVGSHKQVNLYSWKLIWIFVAWINWMYIILSHPISMDECLLQGYPQQHVASVHL